MKKAKDNFKKQFFQTPSERRQAREQVLGPLEKDIENKRNAWLELLPQAVPRPELALGKRIDCTVSEFRNHVRKALVQTRNEHLLPEEKQAYYEALQYLSAFGTDACTDTKGSIEEDPPIEPTPFCFIRGSGGQYFLDTVRNLMTKVDHQRLCQTLFQPWTYEDDKLSMRWDPIEDKRYALIDNCPKDESVSTVWMANLLAYRALALFPCAPTRYGLGTTAWTTTQTTNEENPSFTWPLWDFPATADTVRTMLQLPELFRDPLDRASLRSRGISAVYRSDRIKVPPRGVNYKLNFTPACAIL